MLKNVYAIKDEKVGFLAPILEENDNVSIRNFSYTLSDSANICNFAKADFNLYYLGTFDTANGMFDQEVVPKLICSGGSL